MNNVAAIQLQGVTKVYAVESQKVPALAGVDLSIRKGAVAAITGKSGAGKSTVMHIIGALDQPTTGKVIVNNVDISTMRDNEASRFRNGSIGFVFQMSHLLPEFSALENVMLPGLIASANREAVRERAAGLLTAVGLGARLRHRPGELSGGELQRVAIARALLMAPPILLADEPTGNLDQKTSHAVQDLLLQLCQERGMTMLLVTHDLDLAARVPNRIVMEDGRVIEGGVIQ